MLRKLFAGLMSLSTALLAGALLAAMAWSARALAVVMVVLVRFACG